MLGFLLRSNQFSAIPDKKKVSYTHGKKYKSLANIIKSKESRKSGDTFILRLRLSSDRVVAFSMLRCSLCQSCVWHCTETFLLAPEAAVRNATKTVQPTSEQKK